MTIENLQAAENWVLWLKKTISLLERQKIDIAEYQQKPDANKKAVEIRLQTIDIFENLIQSTQTIVTMQRDMLKSNNALQSKHSALLLEHKILKRYAASKGCDLDLLPFMTLKDI